MSKGKQRLDDMKRHEAAEEQERTRRAERTAQRITEGGHDYRTVTVGRGIQILCRRCDARIGTDSKCNTEQGG